MFSHLNFEKPNVIYANTIEAKLLTEKKNYLRALMKDLMSKNSNKQSIRKNEESNFKMPALKLNNNYI